MQIRRCTEAFHACFESTAGPPCAVHAHPRSPCLPGIQHPALFQHLPPRGKGQSYFRIRQASGFAISRGSRMGSMKKHGDTWPQYDPAMLCSVMFATMQCIQIRGNLDSQTTPAPPRTAKLLFRLQTIAVPAHCAAAHCTRPRHICKLKS